MTLIKEIDFGTRSSAATRLVSLEVDGTRITVPEGTSIMRASMEAGIKVPKLCATDSLNSFGSCRLCLVEVEGRAGTRTASPVDSGGRGAGGRGG
jgi:formate dehydrogenase major subunit